MLVKKILSKQNRALLSELVRTDFKLRYQGSVLGYAWSLLKPLLMFAILYVVFVKFLKIGSGIPHYPIYLLLGIVIWSFFTEMTGQSLGSIVGRGDLIRKIRIPRWIIIMSASVSALINLGLNLLVVGIFLLLNRVDVTWSILLLPLSLLEVYLFGLGLSLFLAAAFVKFRDLSNIWDVIVQAGFYLTPILYPLSMIPNPFFQKLLLMNPMAQAIQDARYNVVTHDAVTTWSLVPGWKVAIPLFVVAVVLVVGTLYFKKHAKSFAEDL
jgi:ABC-2 type transport system permease protein